MLPFYLSIVFDGNLLELLDCQKSSFRGEREFSLGRHGTQFWTPDQVRYDENWGGGGFCLVFVLCKSETEYLSSFNILEHHTASTHIPCGFAGICFGKAHGLCALGLLAFIFLGRTRWYLAAWRWRK
jgi:hypothetical protein